MIIGQLLRIGSAALLLLFHALRWRLFPATRGQALPERLCQTLERLGPTFVKVGQALSLRRDVLPDRYTTALQALQDHVEPFPGEQAMREIERGLGRGIDALFADFEATPFAAASIAQVHRATLRDGRLVIVKVRRIGIEHRIAQDMRALVAAVRLAQRLVPRLRRHQPLRLIEEVRENLRKETDFRQEARNIRNFADAFASWQGIRVPGVVDQLYCDAVLVQERSGGRRIDDPAVQQDGPRLAQLFVDAYLHQFFVLGVFHGDPHPGNLFITDDGRICFHDFGLVGALSRTAQRSLAALMQAFIRRDAEWLLDAGIDLGILSAAGDRAEIRHGLEDILADYAVLPLKDWSLAEAFLRITRLGRGENILVPRNLLVFMRTMFLIEYVVRSLDPEFRLLDTLMAKGEEVLKRAGAQAPLSETTARLRHEAAVAAEDLPMVLALWLHKLQARGAGLQVSLHLDGLDDMEAHVDRSSNRLAIALVTVGLYVTGSLLMQHSIGPRLWGEMPVLAAAAYGLALWFTLRLARGIARSGSL